MGLSETVTFVSQLLTAVRAAGYETVLLLLRTCHDLAVPFVRPLFRFCKAAYDAVIAERLASLQHCLLRWSVTHRVRTCRAAALDDDRPRSVFRAADIAGLPVPVQRYFEHVLPEGTPLTRWCECKQDCLFRLDPSIDGTAKAERSWLKCEGIGYYAPYLHTLLWPATLQLAPFLWIDGWDSFIDGVGSMVWRLCSVVPMVRTRRQPELDAASLLRLLAEAPLFPTALLPACGVTWLPVDEARAIATLAHAGGLQVRAEFTFNEVGECTEVEAVGGRAFAQRDGRFRQERWRGRWSEYQHLANGMRVPAAGEVAWLLNEGRVTYCKLRIRSIEHFS